MEIDLFKENDGEVGCYTLLPLSMQYVSCKE